MASEHAPSHYVTDDEHDGEEMPTEGVSSSRIFGPGSVTTSRKIVASDKGWDTSRKGLGVGVYLPHAGVTKKLRRSPRRAKTRLATDPRPASPDLFRF